MTGKRTIRISAVIIILGCLLGMGLLNPRISSSVAENQLTYTTESAEGLPPEVAIAIAMGAFRGIAVDFLWIRANKLKQEGKFYEAMQLSDWITKLQPRFPKVWIFHAWNMAYNISVATHTDKERWQWVEAGIRLLREHGIPMNPNDMELHKELAWIFLHKISGNTDNVNRYYKQQLAKRWHGILGEPPETQKERVDFLYDIFDAPDNLEDVFAKEPGAGKIYKYLTVDLHIKEGEPLLVFDARLDALLYQYAARTLGLDKSVEENRQLASQLLLLPPDVITETTIADLEKMRRDPGLKPAWDLLLAHLRKRVLVDKYNMEPDRMARYTEKYGPLDWRCAASHALYWAERGVERGVARKQVESFDLVNTDRLVLQSIQELRRYGTVTFDILTDEYILLPDLRYFPSYERTLFELMAHDRTRKNAYNLYRAGYWNMLADAIRSYYAFGDKATAAKYLDKLNREAAIFDDYFEHWKYRDLETFIREEVFDRFYNSHVANDHVYQSLAGAFIWLVRGDRKRYMQQMLYAQTVYKYYEKRQHRNVTETQQDRMALPPFSEIMTNAFFTAYKSVGPYQQIVLYRGIPAELRLWVYQKLLDDWVKKYGSDKGFYQAFPKPVGYDQWLKYSEKQRQKEKEKNLQRAIRFEQQ